MTYASSLRITRWTPLDDGDAYLLAFVAQGVDFPRAVASIKLLDVWERAWLPEHKAWWIAGSAVTRLAILLPELGDLLVSQGRARQQHAPDHDEAEGAGGAGQKSHKQRRRRRAAAGTPPLVPATVSDAYHELWLREGAPSELVLAARRVLARSAHPDAGGEHHAMVAINNAADVCLTWLEQCSPPTSASA
jgi:hypothetical protein